MQYTNRVAALALTVAVALTLIGSPLPLVACAPPKDVSYVLENEGCGTISWELVAEDSLGDRWDEGAALGSGTCAGAYYTCNCAYVEPSIKTATKSFTAEYNDIEEDYDVWWDITNFNEPVDTYCSPTVMCKGQDGVKSQSVTSWIDYNEGYDEIDCGGQ